MRVRDPDALSAEEGNLAELFGLSPAEGRLTAGLTAGKRLRDIAREADVKITTLRSQLSSILRKVDATSQTDLVRVFANIPAMPAETSVTTPSRVEASPTQRDGQPLQAAACRAAPTYALGVPQPFVR